MNLNYSKEKTKERNMLNLITIAMRNINPCQSLHSYVFRQVQRSRSKMFISLLSCMKISQRCHKIESFVGASVLYSYERVAFPWISPENRYRAKLMTKYHLRYEDDYQLGDGDNFNLNNAISLHVPRTAASF